MFEIRIDSRAPEMILNLKQFDKVLHKTVKEALDGSVLYLKLFLRRKIKNISSDSKTISGWKWYRQSRYHYILRNDYENTGKLAVLDEGLRRSITIKARKAKALMIKTPSGDTFFRASVTIPPRQGMKYLSATGKFLQQFLDRRWTKARKILDA